MSPQKETETFQILILRRCEHFQSTVNYDTTAFLSHPRLERFLKQERWEESSHTL